MNDFSIDAGEADTLTLASGEKACIVATDDRNAIRACKLLKLEFVTVVSFLIRAVEIGRIMLAVEKYKKSEASLEKASRLAGVSLSKMIDILAEYGVESNLEYEDYLKGLKTLRKLWP